ncbi:MAG: 2-oxoglutarate dehydrogenase complex dihydrolipoyllysine-residue succinyltransferase [Tenuifilaceae bacterium]|jgi:2-oxoglutarate dehydrogenase E2 component (dihydrolipoamide succinyltransferase)|nr:2-oxoglutarate dehydrogenase complex dihydrolipoyllysine-residue succinyltransferase [Bacteroidales bacterium]MDI9516868.1 2-oxoglutarate dehydrogenase complex dihydrolipoyllysine-residue succinyltransferase [Bacteroidota bacterium]NLH56649.1 2-oxoglutarate dehydrogenase complex dihydrolipoyllysine-residue succinyltransferase [Rikenellaceae bacterium]OQC64633.1 MAG: Dihydrolipoyllysine-residue succinyltransferase component of 2-oxoglutarate dehydrogenase complex [Bacteroidetes bacterium ADurb
MIIEIVIPSPGESITEVEIARWLVKDNSWVEKDQEVAEVESEKATLPITASQSGLISIKIKEGAAKVGQVACTIDTKAKKPEGLSNESNNEKAEIPQKTDANEKFESNDILRETITPELSKVKATPLAKKLMDEKGLSIEDVISGLRKITTREVLLATSGSTTTEANEVQTARTEERIPMSQLRKKLSQRLVAVKNETAMLTTFNEVDMSRIIQIRKTYQEAFQQKHGVKLGYMSFFTRAVVEALKQHPVVNSRIEDNEIVSPNYYDIGIAVQTPKGLMVPIIRNAEKLTMAQIEREIVRLSEKGKQGRIGLTDLEGGTFTITNGGIFGSMLSTPILNPPQAAILGMHNIVDRPVAIDGGVEIRPVMYIALSYDHRIIDGKDSVGFLVRVKQMLENPEQMLSGGMNPDRLLLDI